MHSSRTTPRAAKKPDKYRYRACINTTNAHNLPPYNVIQGTLLTVREQRMRWQYLGQIAINPAKSYDNMSAKSQHQHPDQRQLPHPALVFVLWQVLSALNEILRTCRPTSTKNGPPTAVLAAPCRQSRIVTRRSLAVAFANVAMARLRRGADTTCGIQPPKNSTLVDALL